jgi:hypothetical protein
MDAVAVAATTRPIPEQQNAAPRHLGRRFQLPTFGEKVRRPLFYVVGRQLGKGKPTMTYPRDDFEGFDEAEAEDRRQQQRVGDDEDFETRRILPSNAHEIDLVKLSKLGGEDYEQSLFGGEFAARLDGSTLTIIRRPQPPPSPQPSPSPPQSSPRILSSAEFVAGFVPPDYVLEGVLQRRFIYSLTGKTGAGKTAIMLRIAAHVGEGKKLGDHDVEAGRVLYFAGENADDVRMRWIAMAQQMDFDIETIDVHFIAGTFKFSEMIERIRVEIAKVGEVTLIMIDTSAAYFEGDNENDNKQIGDHARRTRAFTGMPGNPCVVTACHPVKNASDDNLLPRGGGAFIAEIDGNLTARSDAGSVELSTQGKFRGPDFTPMFFQLRTVTHERLKDGRGRLIPTVVASPLSEQAREDIAKAMRSKEDELLVALLDPANQRASKTDLARRLGWKMGNGEPYRVLVSRVLETLKKEKLITIKRGVITLTEEGKKAADQACSGASSRKPGPNGPNVAEQPDWRS